MKVDAFNILGESAAQLFKLRDEAEFDVLAAIALNPKTLFPFLQWTTDITLDSFACEQHRIAYVIFEAYHQRGDAWCHVIMERAMVLNHHKTAIVARMFDTFPPLKDHVLRCAERLTRLASACERAQQSIDAARYAVSEALAQPKYIAGSTTTKPGDVRLSA